MRSVTIRSRGASLLSVAAALAITVPTLGAPAAAAEPFDQPGQFYDTRGLPEAPAGHIFRSAPAPLPLTAGVPGLPPLQSPLPATAERMIYQTADINGAPIATSGALYESTAPWDGPGPRPTVVIGPGTQGQADECAPSRNIETGVGTNPRTGVPMPSYEEGFALVLASRGFRVMVPDYIGLGTPGIHTYGVRSETAHAMLDGARAAVARSAEPSTPVLLWGHSQGGGASAAAVELAGEYAPELDIRAAYASAPPADLLAVLDHIDGTQLFGAIGFAINGMADRYPELQGVIDRNVTDAGRHALKDMSTMCLLDIRMQYGGNHTSQWTNTGQPLGTLIRNEPNALRVMEEQRIGKRVPAVPVMLAGGITDDTIPVGQVEELGRNWCEQGATVHFHHDPTPKIGTLNHVAAAVANFEPGVQFLMDRLAGVPAPNDCGSF